MTDMIPNREQLLSLIEGAFSGTTYPGDDRLVYDSSGSDLECEEIAQAFRTRSWRDVPLDMLQYHHASLFFFTPDAYLYYLPAYLIASALHYSDAGNIPGSVVFSFTSGDVPRITYLNEKQRQAVQAFLTFMKAHYGEDDALNVYDDALAAIRALQNPVRDEPEEEAREKWQENVSGREKGVSGPFFASFWSDTTVQDG